MKTNLGKVRMLGILEGISWILLLGVGMPLKYFMDMPTPNKIIGMAHGVLFILYNIYVYVVKEEYGWPWSKAIWAFIASILPFGTFVAEKRLFQDA